MLSIIYKNLSTETVQDQAKLNLSIFTVHKASSLMDNCASGAGKLTVNFQYGFIRAEAYCCMVRIILGKTHCKFLIDILRICRAKGDFHIHTSSIYAIQTNYILKSNILIFCLICAKILNFPNRFLDQAAVFNGKLSCPSEITAYEVLAATETSLFDPTPETLGEQAPYLEQVMVEDVFQVLDDTVKETLSGITLEQLAQKAIEKSTTGYMYYL